MFMPYLRSILIACLGVEAFCCLEVMVNSCWLCCSGKRLVDELLKGFVVIF